jgi:hypothetical protein
MRTSVEKETPGDNAFFDLSRGFKFWTGRLPRRILVFMLFGKVLLLKVLLGFGFGVIILALL